MVGRGKYDKVCTLVRETLKAKGVILIVIDDVRGHGMSVQAPMAVQMGLSQILRLLADKVDAEMPGCPPKEGTP